MILPKYYDTSGRIVFVRFLKELKTPKRRFKINWPLVLDIYCTLPSCYYQHSSLSPHFGSYQGFIKYVEDIDIGIQLRGDPIIARPMISLFNLGKKVFFSKQICVIKAFENDIANKNE